MVGRVVVVGLVVVVVGFVVLVVVVVGFIVVIVGKMVVACAVVFSDVVVAEVVNSSIVDSGSGAEESVCRSVVVLLGGSSSVVSVYPAIVGTIYRKLSATADVMARTAIAQIISVITFFVLLLFAFFSCRCPLA